MLVAATFTTCPPMMNNTFQFATINIAGEVEKKCCPSYSTLSLIYGNHWHGLQFYSVFYLFCRGLKAYIQAFPQISTYIYFRKFSKNFLFVLKINKPITRAKQNFQTFLAFLDGEITEMDVSGIELNVVSRKQRGKHRVQIQKAWIISTYSSILSIS